MADNLPHQFMQNYLRNIITFFSEITLWFSSEIINVKSMIERGRLIEEDLERFNLARELPGFFRKRRDLFHFDDERFLLPSGEHELTLEVEEMKRSLDNGSQIIQDMYFDMFKDINNSTERYREPEVEAEIQILRENLDIEDFWFSLLDMRYDIEMRDIGIFNGEGFPLENGEGFEEENDDLQFVIQIQEVNHEGVH